MTDADETAEARLEQARRLFRAGRCEQGLQAAQAGVVRDVHDLIARAVRGPKESS